MTCERVHPQRWLVLQGRIDEHLIKDLRDEGEEKGGPWETGALPERVDSSPQADQLAAAYSTRVSTSWRSAQHTFPDLIGTS